MAESVREDGGKIIVDFSGDKKTQHLIKDRSKLTEYANVDLASGYRSNLIWTTKDGRKIAIPNLSDSHLLNIISYLQARTKKYKMQIAAKMLMGALAQVMMFEHLPDDVLDGYSEESMKQIDKLKALPNEDFLKKVFPIYSKLKEEAYKRKLTVEECNDPEPQHALEAMDDYDNEQMWGDS